MKTRSTTPSQRQSHWWSDAAAAISSVTTRKFLRLSLAWIFCASCSFSSFAASPLLYTASSSYQGTAPQWTYRIAQRVEQDRSLFTQGLQFHRDQLWISSGQYGQSRLIALDGNNVITQHVALPLNVFAEGLAVVDDTVFVLTWHEEKLLRFSARDLSPLPPLHYSGEGWGLAYDGKQLIRSDGSDALFFHDTKNFRVTKKIRVHDDKYNLTRLNELEWVHGLLLANIWITNTIVVIDPANGAVKAHLDLGGLLSANEIQDDTDVLNGIAWDEKRKVLWVTGKRWPARFALEVDALKP